MPKADEVDGRAHCRRYTWMARHSDHCVSHFSRVVDRRRSRQSAIRVICAMADSRRVDECGIDIADMNIRMIRQLTPQSLRKPRQPEFTCAVGGGIRGCRKAA